MKRRNYLTGRAGDRVINRLQPRRTYVTLQHDTSGVRRRLRRQLEREARRAAK